MINWNAASERTLRRLRDQAEAEKNAAVSAERDACAAIAQSRADQYDKSAERQKLSQIILALNARAEAAESIADAIRARSEEPTND